jgi:predicted O-methyltransferase YrrM
MSDTRWSAVDEYYANLLVPDDAVFNAVQQAARDAELPNISVSTLQGKFLYLLAKIHGARRVLEIGTLAGYSTIWLARALPNGGKIVTLEYEPKHAEVARRNFEAAGVADRIELREGLAAGSLATLIAEHGEPFDFVFIDADKQSTADYFTAAMQLIRPGGIILVDNVVRDGKIADPSHNDADLQGIRRFNGVLAADRRVCATMIQTVGAKGYDGFTLIRVAE